MFKKKRFLIIGAVIILVVSLFFLSDNYFKEEIFSVNTILLKLNVPLEGETISNVKITNLEKTEQHFNIHFNSLGELASVDEKEFVLGGGESKDIKIYFRDIKNEVGIYPGQLIIETSELRKEIPIILGIEDKNRVFAVIQTSIPKYEEIYPGGKFGLGVKIFNLQDLDLYNVKVRYSIKNFDNELIFSEDEDLVIKGSLETTKIVDIPETLSYGDYVFITSIEYDGSRTEAGYLFTISQEKKESFSGSFNYFIIILLFVVGILVVFFRFIKTRDDLLLNLNRQQDKEFKRNLDVIAEYKSEIKKLKNRSERAKELWELDKIKRNVVRHIKSKHKRQRRELKKLKEKGKKEEMTINLKKWEKEGYAMFGVGKGMSKLSKVNVRKQIQSWKRKGYDTSFLEKE